MMRNECGYNGRMAYWEEFSDAGNFRNSAFLRDFGGSGDSDGYVHDNEFSTIDLNLGPGLENHRRKLRRSINDTASAMGSQQYVDEAMSKNTFVEFLATIRSFSHLAGHNGVGGELGDVQTAPVDIIFFSHHIYIDYLWDKWQRARPEARLFDIQRSGYETQANPIVETNYMTDISFLGLAPSVPMYSALDTQGGFLCYVYE
uniref:Tyrosinase copper-binding domain-containing protein n=1 Tax=Phakopsora pachyrhizi TaxID=170000 RepID=A0A0S1MK18_PHAPC